MGRSHHASISGTELSFGGRGKIVIFLIRLKDQEVSRLFRGKYVPIFNLQEFSFRGWVGERAVYGLFVLGREYADIH